MLEILERETVDVRPRMENVAGPQRCVSRSSSRQTSPRLTGDSIMWATEVTSIAFTSVLVLNDVLVWAESLDLAPLRLSSTRSAKHRC